MAKRAKSFSIEKRRNQDRQAFIALGSLIGVSLLGFLWDAAAPHCWGALQGAWSPLLILALRYSLRVVKGLRYDVWAIVDALVFLGYTIGILICLFPKDVWQTTIVLLCLISTVIGIQRFKFTPLFMFINCLIAGAILL